MIDIVYPPRTPAHAKITKQLKLDLWVLGEADNQGKVKAVLFDPKKKQGGSLKIIDGQHPQLRHYIEKGFANAIIWLETAQEGDKMHARRSPLNQVLAAIMAKRNCIVLFDHSLIRKAKGPKRAQLLGRMRQNVQLCKKYKVKMAVVTMAKSPYELRNPRDLQSFALQLGMTRVSELAE